MDAPILDVEAGHLVVLLAQTSWQHLATKRTTYDLVHKGRVEYVGDNLCTKQLLHIRGRTLSTDRWLDAQECLSWRHIQTVGARNAAVAKFRSLIIVAVVIARP